MKFNSPFWRVAHKLSEDFQLSVEDMVLKDGNNSYWIGNRRFELKDFDSLKLKKITILNSDPKKNGKVFQHKDNYEADLIYVLKGKIIELGYFWNIAFDLRRLDLSNELKLKEIKLNFEELVKFRDVYKYFLSELKKTKLPTTEDLELERVKENAEQKLLAEGPLAIAQKEFEETLSAAQKEFDEMYVEILAELKKGSININLEQSERQFEEKLRIQPFLQLFWDEINQSVLKEGLSNKSRFPTYVTSSDGKNVLETQQESKSAFFKLIPNSS